LIDITKDTETISDEQLYFKKYKKKPIENQWVITY